MSTTDESRAVVERFQREIFQQGRMELLDEMVAEDYVVHTPTGDQTREEHFQKELPGFLRAFPDLELHIEDRVAEEDKVVTRFYFTGTHKGEFARVPPTGASVTVPGIVIERVEDGKVAEAWVERNDMWLMQQLGAVPAPA